MEGSFTGRTNKKALPEVENSNDTTPWSDVVDSAETDTASDTSPRAQDSATRKHGGKGGEVPHEFVKQKDFFSGPLLPSEVCCLGTGSDNCLFLMCMVVRTWVSAI